MDYNGDNTISARELQEALKRGQSNSEFNFKTIELLLQKYDTNGDKQISFEEFYDLFLHLNEEYENFLLMDEDGSGEIDFNELSNALEKKGYSLSEQFYKFIINEMQRNTGHSGIKFDNYIRIAARFDYLCKYYRKSSLFQKYPMETYLRSSFFENFW
jgi:Ca2+-binding EF-hand superfamily protein